MPTLFRVTRYRNTRYFEVWAGEMPSLDECRARQHHLRSMGWRTAEISKELATVRRLRRMNKTRTNTLDLSLQYVFEYFGPGDVLWVGDLLTVCQAEGRA